VQPNAIGKFATGGANLHNWFKNVPPPVPICYCANVTEEEILHHVAVAQCCSTLDEIKRHTGANTGCECLTKNPAGG
jgi:NAD(P)H-nitrite reductase large subunit